MSTSDASYPVLCAEPIPDDLRATAKAVLSGGFRLRIDRGQSRDELLTAVGDADFPLVAAGRVDQDLIGAASTARSGFTMSAPGCPGRDRFLADLSRGGRSPIVGTPPVYDHDRDHRRPNQPAHRSRRSPPARASPGRRDLLLGGDRGRRREAEIARIAGRDPQRTGDIEQRLHDLYLEEELLAPLLPTP